MTLASEDGNRLLSKKPYRDVLQRWRMCLATLFLVVVVLADNFRVSSSCTSTTTAAATTSAAFVMAVVITGPMFPSGSNSKLTATAQTAPTARVDPPSTNSSPPHLTTTAPQPPAPPTFPPVYPPWIPNKFLSDYTFNAIARAIKCLQSVPTPENFCFYNSSATVGDLTMPSSVSNSTNTPRPNQCLHYMLRRDKVEELCAHKRSVIANLRLGFCYRFTVSRVLGDIGLHNLTNANGSQCATLLNELQDLDETAQKIYCEFEQILSRYDCLQQYSIRWNCSDCTDAYKAWVCSMIIPYREGDRSVKPCRDVCHTMEQRCPYFLPDAKLQYAGEPTFLCIDHDIPETETMGDKSSYGVPPNCYLPCHLDSKNLTLDHCVYSSVANQSGTRVSWGSNSSFSSFSFYTTSSASSGSLWRVGSSSNKSVLQAVSLYVVTVFGLLLASRTFFSSPPFCLGLT